jgi:hypothetical protein
MLQVCGPLTVAVPGTLIRASSTVTTDAHGVVNNPARFKCHAALFQAKKGNVGIVYIGLTGLNRSTLVGVAAQLAIPTSNSIPSFSVALTLSPDGVDLSDLWIDADNAGDGVILTLLVT